MKMSLLLVLFTASLNVAAQPDAFTRDTPAVDAVAALSALPVQPQGTLELVQDGGFEAGIVPTYWAQTSTNYGTPLCATSCGGLGPRSGLYWAWFGGAGAAAEAGSLQQTGTIPVGKNLLLFYLRWTSSVVSPPDPAAILQVRIDGNVVFSIMPATAFAYSSAYGLVSVDISAYADGNVHTLRFEASNAAASASTNILVDDISLGSDGIFTNSFE